MQSKISLKRTLSVIIFIGYGFFLGFFLNFVQHSSHLFVSRQIKSDPPLLTASTVTVYEQEQVRFALPVRLKIPKINVDTSVEYVGLTSDGAMDVPKSPTHVAWFNLGQRPGENGSAVIAGHYGWKNGKASAFDNLYKLHKGDKLYVEDDKGVITSFVVRESRRYNPKADASGVFGSNDGNSHLNLITCEGVWNKVSRGYSKRLVVFTDKEME